MNAWRFLNTGFHSGAFNMEYDEMLAKSCLQETGGPVVRVYGWDPDAISLGWSQSFDEIDMRKASSAGIDVVRRPTGGRAILHSAELTYCVVMPSDGKKVLTVYDEISKALVCGLQKLGVEANLEKCQPHFPSEYSRRSSSACFTTIARYEIKANGKKLVGSAQRRFSKGDGQEVVLQHGSILLGPDHEQIADFLNVNDAGREEIRGELKSKTTDVSSVLQREVNFEDAVDVIRNGFEESWNIKFERAVSEEVILS